MSATLGQPWAPSSTERNLWLAIGVSVFLHATVLSLQFKFPDASRAFQDKALDIILVNSKSARKPTNAQALAQANLDGGGRTDQDRRARSPLPPSARQQSGADLEQAQRRVQELEAQQQQLATMARSKTTVALKQDKEAQTEPTPGVSGRDLAQSARAMVRNEAEIFKDIEEYNKRPKLRTLDSVRTQEFSAAQYLEEWRIKVERIGTLNFPEAAKNKFYGSLRLWVVLRADGSIYKVEVVRSSGHKILDEAARRIVAMGAPYGRVPQKVLDGMDTIGFSREIAFTRDDAVATSAAK